MARMYLVVAALGGLAAAMVGPARATTAEIQLFDAGIGATIDVTYGAATDPVYPTGYEVTAISGTFSDTNNGLAIINAPILGLIPINHATPAEPDNIAPADFSRYPTISLPGLLTYDNLFFPGGSDVVGPGYAFNGGLLDFYGLMFDIGNGMVANIWSNGLLPDGSLLYGAAVANTDVILDYVAAVPEPGSVWLVGAGLLGLFVWRRRGAGGSRNLAVQI
jgi:PEP-CTERM motif